MRFNKLHLKQEPFYRFIKDTLNVSFRCIVVSTIAFTFCLFIGCATNYKQPLRFGGNTSGQNLQDDIKTEKSNVDNNEYEPEYLVDTLYIIDTLIEKYPVDTTESSDITQEYESCPVIFDTMTAGDHLAEAELILRDYWIDLLPGSFFYKKYIHDFIDKYSIYISDILDYILELLGLDKVLDKRRFPVVYVYLTEYLSPEFSQNNSDADIISSNYIYENSHDYSSFDSRKSETDNSINIPIQRGLDTVY